MIMTAIDKRRKHTKVEDIHTVQHQKPQYLIAISTMAPEKTFTNRGIWVHIYMPIRTTFIRAQSCQNNESESVNHNL